MMWSREESSCQVASPALSAEKALQNWLLTIPYYHVPGRLFHASFMLLHYNFFFLVISQPSDPAPTFDTRENSHAHNVWQLVRKSNGCQTQVGPWGCLEILFYLLWYRWSPLLYIAKLSGRCCYDLRGTHKETEALQDHVVLPFISIILNPLNSPITSDIFITQEKLRLGEIKPISPGE